MSEPAEQVIYGGVALPTIKDGDLIMDAVFLIKTLNTEGKVCYREFKTPSLHPIEALGMCTTFEDTLRSSIMGNSHRMDE